MRWRSPGIILFELLGATCIFVLGSMVALQLAQRIRTLHAKTVQLVHERVLRKGSLLFECMITLALALPFACGICMLVQHGVQQLARSERWASRHVTCARHLCIIARDVACASPYATDWDTAACVWPCEGMDESGERTRQWVGYRCVEGRLTRESGSYDPAMGVWQVRHVSPLGISDVRGLRVQYSPDGRFVVAVRVQRAPAPCCRASEVVLPVRGGVLAQW